MSLQRRESHATPTSVGYLRRWIEDICDRAGATKPERADIALAVSEALSNVVMHAYVGRAEPGAIRISAEVFDHRLLVEVEDDGIGMRPRIDSPGAGLGLKVIAALATEVEFARSSSGRGARVRMAFAVG